MLQPVLECGWFQLAKRLAGQGSGQAWQHL